MARYGQYEIDHRLNESAWVTTYAVRATDMARQVRAFRPAPGPTDPEDARRAAEYFARAARVQQAVAAKSQAWAGVHEVGQSGPWPYMVTDHAPWSVQDLIDLRLVTTAGDLHVIVQAILRGLLDLKVHCGRGHGNLRPHSISLSELRVARARIFLTDPGADNSAAPEPADLAALANIIHLLVFHRPYSTKSGLPPLSAWNVLGPRGAVWREYCHNLMGRGAQPMRLADAAAQLPRMPRKMLPWGILAACVAAVILVVGGLQTFTHIKTTVSADAWGPYAAATWFHTRPADAPPLDPSLPEALRTSDDPAARFAAAWDKAAAATAENDPAKVLGKPLASVGSDPAQVVSVLKGDSAARMRLDAAVKQAVKLEYQLGAVYRELESLNQYFAADPRAKDAPEDAVSHWNGVQKLTERLMGPDYVTADVPASPGGKSLADYVDDKQIVIAGVKPMRPQDPARIKEWFEKLLLLRQVKAEWEALAPEGDVALPPEEFFRLYAARQVGERETEGVDLNAIVTKLTHLAEINTKLRTAVAGHEETVDWDQWQSTYREAAHVTEEQEFTDWAENIAGFDRLVLTAQDKQKLEPAENYADAAGKSLMQLRIYDRTLARTYTMALARQKEWLSSWSDSRVRDENDRVVLVRDRITFNPWFDSQVKTHQSSLGKLSRTIGDKVVELVKRLNDKQDEIMAQAEKWKAGDKLDRLCYDLLSRRFEFPAAPADPIPDVRQKLTAEFDAYSQSYATLYAGYRTIADRLATIPSSEKVAGTEAWSANLNQVLVNDRIKAIQDAQDAVHSAGDLPVVDEATFGGVLTWRADRAAATKTLADQLLAIEALADGMYLPDTGPPGGTSIRALHERVQPLLTDHAFAAAVAPLEQEIITLLKIADSKNGRDLAAQADGIGKRLGPVCRLTLFYRLAEPAVAEPRLLAAEAALGTETLPDAINNIPSAARRKALLAQVETDRIARGYRRMEDRLAGQVDDAALQESLRLAKSYKLNLPDGVLRLSDLKPGSGTLQPKNAFNLMRYTLQQYCRDIAAPDMENVKLHFEEDLAALAPALSKDSLTGLSDAMKNVTMGSVSMLTKHGPELAGWTRTNKGSGQWEYSLPGHPTLLFKALVGPDGRAFCLCTTVASLALIESLGTPDVIQQVEGAKIQDFTDQPGPRVWRWDPARHWFDRSDMWLTNQSGVESHYAPELRGKELYQLSEIHGGDPNEDHPMQYISIEMAAFLAARMGCRLPSEGEWQAAYALHRTQNGALPNFRGKTFAEEREYVLSESHPSIPTLLSTTWGNFDLLAALNQGDEAIETSTMLAAKENGILWFSGVDRVTTDPNSDAGHTFHHLLGNVMQLVVTQEVKDKLDQLAPIDAVTRYPDPSRVLVKDVVALGLSRTRQKKVWVVGGSSLSPVDASLPAEKAVPIVIPDKAGWSDVGFRLAFTAEDPLSTKILDVLRKHGYLN